MTTNTCPVCERDTANAWCCGIHLAAPFRMTKSRVLALRRYVHGRKGLDETTYRMHLQAVGVSSTLDLTRDTHNALLRRMGALPDKPKGTSPGRARQ